MLQEPIIEEAGNTQMTTENRARSNEDTLIQSRVP